MRGRKPNYKTILMKAKDESPRAPLRIPRAPTMLKGEAKAEWQRMTKLLYELGIIAHLDRTTLTLHCTAWAQWVEAQEKLASGGVVVKAPSGYEIQSPWLSVANQAAKQMRELLSEFGLSPAARFRLLGKPKQAEPDAGREFGGLLANVG